MKHPRMSFSRLSCLGPAALALILTGAGASAAVAPHYERIRQLDAAMSVVGEAARLLAPASIERIETIDDGRTFRFWAGPCHVSVTLSVKGDTGSRVPPLVGAPNHYTATPGPRTCR